MRTAILSAFIGVFGSLGCVVFGLGVLAVLAGLSEDDNAFASWYGAYTGIGLIATGALLFVVALLAYIANMVADAADTISRSDGEVPIVPVFDERSRTPWYAQDKWQSD